MGFKPTLIGHVDGVDVCLEDSKQAANLENYKRIDG